MDELFKTMQNRRSNRRGRNFLSRSSTLINMTYSQSQKQSRVGSQLNSRINSAKQTPRGLKRVPQINNHNIKEFFTSSQKAKIDTPASPNKIHQESLSVYDSLRKQSQAAREAI